MKKTGNVRPADRGKPLYQTVFDSLRRRISDGEWTVGQALLSEAELLEAYQVSRITARHALRLLEAEGYIRKNAKRRSVVLATTPPRRGEWMVQSIDDIIAQAAGARLRVLSWRRERSPENARLLHLGPQVPLHCLRGVLLRGDTPFLRSIIYFPPAIGSRLRIGDFNDVIVFRVLARELGISLTDVQITVWPELAGDDDAAHLGCVHGAPLLVTQLLYRGGDGAPIQVSYSRRSGAEARFSTRISGGPEVP